MTETEGDDVDVEDDATAGPELPPDFDLEATEDAADEEGGRFFGGGMERKTAEAMKYIDQHDDENTEVRMAQPNSSLTHAEGMLIFFFFFFLGIF